MRRGIVLLIMYRDLSQSAHRKVGGLELMERELIYEQINCGNVDIFRILASLPIRLFLATFPCLEIYRYMFVSSINPDASILFSCLIPACIELAPPFRYTESASRIIPSCASEGAAGENREADLRFYVDSAFRNWVGGG